MQSTHQQWLPIPGYEGHYEVSTLGRVRSLDRVIRHAGGTRKSPGRTLKLQTHPTGYVQVTLCRDGQQENRKVHHLVLETFVGPRPSGMHACHGDGDTFNNSLSNLRWGTVSENNLDKVRHGTHNNSRKTHCLRGHAYVESNIYRPPSNPRERACRACRRAHHRALTEARKAAKR